MIKTTTLTIELQCCKLGNYITATHGRIQKAKQYTIKVHYDDEPLKIQLIQRMISKGNWGNKISELHGNCVINSKLKTVPEDLLLDICKAIVFYSNYSGNVLIDNLPALHYPDYDLLISNYKHLANSKTFIVRGATIDNPELLPYITAWVTLKQLTKEN